jgi:hypothetical protein
MLLKQCCWHRSMHTGASAVLPAGCVYESISRFCYIVQVQLMHGVVSHPFVCDAIHTEHVYHPQHGNGVQFSA